MREEPVSNAQRGSAPIAKSAKIKASMAMGNVTKKEATAYREQDRTSSSNRSTKSGPPMRPVPQKGGPSGGYQTGRVKPPSNQAQRIARQAEMRSPKQATSRSVLRKASAAMGSPNKSAATAYRKANSARVKKMGY